MITGADTGAPPSYSGRQDGTRYLLAALGILLALARCSAPPPVSFGEGVVPPGAETVEVEGRAGGSLTYALAGEPDTLNYLASSNLRSKLLTYLTTGTLLEFDAVDQVVVPGVAQAWELLDGGRSVRLTLREGLRFSDGVPVSTEDVVFTFSKIFEEESRNTLKETLLIGGAAPQIEKLNERDFVVHFPTPHPNMEFLLSTIPVMPEHLLALTDSRPVEQYWALGTPPDSMAGLGPFRVVEQESGQGMILARNPHYWRVDAAGTQLPYLDQVRLRYLPDRNTQVLSLTAGELDLIDQLLNPDDLGVLAGNESLVSENLGSSSNLTLLWFNLGPRTEWRYQWFRNPDFRNALSLAVNREDIVSTVFGGYASPAAGFVTPANRRWFVPELALGEYDARTSIRLLTSLGFRLVDESTGKSLRDAAGRPVGFELLTGAGDLLGRIAAIVQQDLLSIGVHVTIRQEEQRSFVSRVMGSRDYDAALMNLDMPLEPWDMRNFLLSSGGIHIWNPVQEVPATSWEAQIDGLMENLGNPASFENRFGLFREVQRIMYAERPIVPLLFRNVLVVRHRSVRNLRVARVFPYAWSRIWEVYRSEE